MPYMLALDPSSDSAKELVLMGFTRVKVLMRIRELFFSQAHLTASDAMFYRTEPRPQQYCSVSFWEDGNQGSLYGIVFSCSPESKQVLLRQGFQERWIYRKLGPSGSTLQSIPSGDEIFRKMRHVPEKFATTSYWGRMLR